MRDRVKKNPSDKQMAADYAQFLREKNEEELAVFTRAAEAYPTQLDYQFNMATRLFQLERFGEAIPVFQRARNDPKYRTEASVWLGKSFLEAGFSDEAVDTLKDIIDTYQLRGDEKSIEMTYWYGRSLEAKSDMPAAIKAYSQVAQWSFTYKDVQQRIKTLRAAAT
jgi:tetratricopeptide (TPR) repeat protein